MGMYAFNPALATRHENMTEAFQVARNLGYDGTDPKDVKKLIAFFKKSNMEKFILFRSETKCNTVIESSLMNQIGFATVSHIRLNVNLIGYYGALSKLAFHATE